MVNKLKENNHNHKDISIEKIMSKRLTTNKTTHIECLDVNPLEHRMRGYLTKWYYKSWIIFYN